jgi:hypothetical protein
VTAAKADSMLSMLRSAGARGVTRGELFDTLKIGNPDYLTTLLEQRGHTIMATAETVHHPGGVTGTTHRFTLMVDGADQRAMFEGDATDELGTWHADPVDVDERRIRAHARHA